MIELEKLNVDRDVYEVTYPSDEIQGDTIHATFENASDGDKSVYVGVNDGRFVVTVAQGFDGNDHVVISGSVGGSIDADVRFTG